MKPRSIIFILLRELLNALVRVVLMGLPPNLSVLVVTSLIIAKVLDEYLQIIASFAIIVGGCDKMC